MQGSVDYVIFFPSTPSGNERRGNYSEDFNNGVYHLLVGQDSGIVHQLKFAKRKIPYYEEKQYANHSRALNQFYRFYNADVTLFGTTLFQPAQKIYINPTYMSNLKSPSDPGSIFRRFGLGGYYQVTTVKHVIDEGGFSTDLSCIWLSPGDKRKKNNG
jgi:hypothetical protein